MDRKGGLYWEERGKTVAVWYYEELPKGEAMRIVRLLEQHQKPATGPQAMRPNVSFGRSLYWEQRDMKEVATFIVWLLCSTGLFALALWDWSSRF